MPIDTRPITTLQDAGLLGDLVYSTYGLTYHRGFIYEGERLLELNRSGAICSMIAVDRDSGRVVGHQATIRPWFEIADPLAPGTGAPVLEIGLSIVHPQWRGQGIQNMLALALLMHVPPRNAELAGVFMKCVTNTVASQRSARRFLGGATCLLLAGVPAWVVMDGDDGPRQPITTVLIHCPVGERRRSAVVVPGHHAAVLDAVYRAAGLARDLHPVSAAPGALGPSEIRTWFDPARRQGVVRLLRPGDDLVEAVAARVDWLVGGHIEHVTVLLPLACDAVAASVASLEDRGLFFGGVIPDLEGVDTLVMEHVDAPGLDPSGIEVVGDAGRCLRDYVLAGWRRCLDRRGIAAPPCDRLSVE